METPVKQESVKAEHIDSHHSSTNFDVQMASNMKQKEKKYSIGGTPAGVAQ